MLKLRSIAQGLNVLVFLGFLTIASFAQVTTGNVRGLVTDPNGAIVPNAKVTITKQSTKTTNTAQTTENGEFQFNNLLTGNDYTIVVEAASFKTLTLNDVSVQLNQATDINAQLTVGQIGETVEVTAGGAELVDTTTSNLSRSFSSRQVVELAQTSVGSGVNNLALIAPNVSSSGGVGVGSGGSVGGQRPRNNNFVLDGVDNNDKSVTGPQIYVSPEVVSEFTLLQNQFSPEFARSNGGQFITVTKFGTNDFHGSAYAFLRNRYLNALDTLQKDAGIFRERSCITPSTPDCFFPRSDYGRFGVNLGGPVILPRFGEGGPSTYNGRNKLFFFTSYERLQTGAAGSPGGITTPTAAGFATLNSIPGLSGRNLGVFNTFVPVAPINNAGNITVAGRSIPVGSVSFSAPSFTKQNYVVANIDYTQSDKTQHRARFSLVNFAGIDATANLPAFFVATPLRQRLFSYSLIHTFSQSLTNETRLAFRRSDSSTPVTNAVFPGLTVFPNIGLFDLNLDVGPNPNAPQFTIENNYQIIDNVAYSRGKHSFKFGGDYRRVISPQTFVQRQRGDYQYSTTDLFLRDISPDVLGERNVGTSPYAGDQKLLYAYAQDDWRATQNLTLNLGVNYSYQGVPRGAEDQARNALASVPGLLEFREPKPQLKNFAPKVGFAYSPSYDSGVLGRVFGNNGRSALRAGFSIGYDYIFDNLYILAAPPQSQQTVGIDLTRPTSNFLANGGIPDAPTPITDPATARANTASFIPDQQVPYSITYTVSYQRQFAQDYSVEVRYLGTRGVHLLTQNRLNSQPRASASIGGLPTFLTLPSQAQLNALTLNFAAVNARSNYPAQYANAGFNSARVVGFLSNGNSTYNGGSISLQRRFSTGFQATAAYTWSHLIDDTTAEVFSTVLSPRRVEDFQNLRTERADSALDRRHRLVISSLYALPFFNNSSNGFVRAILGGFNFAGTLTFESGQKATVLSGIDSNGNGDAAGDRTIRNPNGVRNSGSAVCAIDRTGQCIRVDPLTGVLVPASTPGSVTTAAPATASARAATFAYLAFNPNAEYIQAGLGAVSTSARNTLQLPGINNLDFSIFKNFRFGETRRIQIRADFFNTFNHPQYIPGSPNDVTPIATTGVGNVNTISINTINNNLFNNPSQTFSSNPRVIQMALRFDF